MKGFRHSLSRQDKVDPKDAHLVTRYLGVPDLHLHPWQADQEGWPLRFLTRFRCRLAHHLAQVKGYTYTWIYLKASAFPQVKPFQNLFGKTSLELLCQAPSLEPLLQLPTEELAETIAQLGRGGFRDPLETARQVQQAARASYPLDPATAQVVHFALQQSVELIRELEKHLRATDRRIAERVQGDADIANLDSIGGLGSVYAAGLAAEMRPTQRFFQGEKYDLQRRQWRVRTAWDAQAAVAKLAGLWWPRRASGQFEGEDRHMPLACNAYLRYYLVEAAQHVREHVPEYQAYYRRKYAETRKHPHQRALVLTARKLARLVFILLHKHETYQPRRCKKA